MDRSHTQVDVITAIVSQVHSQDTLATLARVSRTVSEPALDKLWRVPHSLVNLARCMPEEHWEEVEKYKEVFPGSTRFTYESRITLSEHPRMGDWLGSRFRSYARRIKQLSTDDHISNRLKWPIRTPYVHTQSDPVEEGLTDAEGLGAANNLILSQRQYAASHVTSSLHPDVLQSWLFFSRDVMPLFSKLDFLRWKARGGNDLPLITVFLVPSITHLNLIADSSSTSELSENSTPFAGDTLASIIRAAAPSCPSLRSLDLSVTQDMIESFRAITSDLPLHNLKHFQSGFFSIPVGLLRSIATWTHLQTCCITLPPDPVVFPRNATALFPAVRTLRLKGSNLDCLLSVWSAVQSSRVHTLELSPDHKLLPSQIVCLLGSITSHPSAASIRDLTFSLSISSRTPWPLDQPPIQPEESTSMDTIEPSIETLTMLESFKFEQRSRYLYVFTPAIRSMLQTWRNIKTIHIPNKTPERIMMKDFLSILRDRPQLNSIFGLEVDFCIEDSLPDMRGWQHHHLEHIVFEANGSSSVSTANRITLVHQLLSAFPRLPSRCIQGDGALRMFAYRAIRAREAGAPWGLNDYQKVLTGSRVAVSDPFTGHYTEDGLPVLCYARAIYNPIVMTSGEYDWKLHLNEGEIVAVTAKHENGKWTGVLLEECYYDPNKDFWGDPDHVEII